MSNEGNDGLPVAQYINQAESRLKQLIHRQFLFTAVVTVLSVASFVGVFAFVSISMRVPINPSLISKLDESNRRSLRGC